MEKNTTSAKQRVLSLLSELRHDKITADDFCPKFMEILAATNEAGPELMDDDFYNNIFDLCVRIEDKLDDYEESVEKLCQIVRSI